MSCIHLAIIALMIAGLASSADATSGEYSSGDPDNSDLSRELDLSSSSSSESLDQDVSIVKRVKRGSPPEDNGSKNKRRRRRSTDNYRQWSPLDLDDNETNFEGYSRGKYQVKQDVMERHQQFPADTGDYKKIQVDRLRAHEEARRPACEDLNENCKRMKNKCRLNTISALCPTTCDLC